MKEITRYDVVDGRFGTTPYFKDEQGMFVKYAEHKGIVSELKKQIKELNKKLDSLIVLN